MFNPFKKLTDSLAKTRDKIIGAITSVVASRSLDDALLEEIEEILIQSDVGFKASTRLIDHIKKTAREKRLTEGNAVIDLLKEEIATILNPIPERSNAAIPPEVWLIVGVNGVGKTTTIGKLATRLSADGKKVMIAACDTFRAAAIDQISIWAERSGVEIIRAQDGADPSSVAFDAAKAAQARGVDILLVDTAGRLHTKSHLMEELKKIRRTVNKAVPDSPILSKLIIDGSTGQNALSQVQVFTEAVGCDGLIITKLDGTAKGGIVIAIAEEMNIPVEYIGIGEGIEDLQKFDAKQFVDALFAKAS
jgi:fused signal recognition particle receptor